MFSPFTPSAATTNTADDSASEYNDALTSGQSQSRLTQLMDNDR